MAVDIRIAENCIFINGSKFSMIDSELDFLYDLYQMNESYDGGNILLSRKFENTSQSCFVDSLGLWFRPDRKALTDKDGEFITQYYKKYGNKDRYYKILNGSVSVPNWELNTKKHIQKRIEISTFSEYFCYNSFVVYEEAGNLCHIKCALRDTHTSEVYQQEKKNRAIDFILAILKNDVDAIKSLLKEGVDINTKLWNLNINMLAVAAYYNRRKTCKFLIEHGANVNNRDYEGGTVLTFAMHPLQPNSYGCVKLLLEHGANVNAVINCYGQTVLCNIISKKVILRDIKSESALKNIFALAELLISYGANVNARFFYATDNVYEKGFQCLLAHSLFRNDMETAQFLLDHGADVNIRNSKGRTLLFAFTMECINSDSEALSKIQFLLKNNADTNACDNNGFTPLMFAIAMGEFNLAELLISYGADINRRDYSGRTVLHNCVSCGSEICKIESIEFILNNGGNADINACDNNGFTPLMLAIDKGEFNFAELLISYGADINRRDYSGRTVLHNCVSCGSEICKIESIEFILNNGGKVNLMDYRGNTPMDIAIKEKFHKAFYMLREYGGTINMRHYGIFQVFDLFRINQLLPYKGVSFEKAGEAVYTLLYLILLVTQEKTSPDCEMQAGRLKGNIL